MRVLQGLHEERLFALRPRMLLLRQNIHLLVHMLLIGRVIWLTRHFYFLINEGGVEELHRVTILVHVIIHCLLEHGGEITIHSAWTAFLTSLASLTQHNRWRRSEEHTSEL